MVSSLYLTILCHQLHGNLHVWTSSRLLPFALELQLMMIVPVVTKKISPTQSRVQRGVRSILKNDPMAFLVKNRVQPKKVHSTLHPKMLNLRQIHIMQEANTTNLAHQSNNSVIFVLQTYETFQSTHQFKDGKQLTMPLYNLIIYTTPTRTY